MDILYRQMEVDRKTGEQSEVFVNPKHLVAFAIVDDKLVKADFTNNTSVYLLGDFFSTMVRDALEIVPIAYKEEHEEVDVNDTEYIDETPLEEPGVVENVPYESTDVSETVDSGLSPEQHAGEDDDYQPEVNAQVEGA